MATSADPHELCQLLEAAIVDLTANRLCVDQLAIHLRMFRFTGGAIPDPHWSISCITEYSAHAGGKVAKRDMGHYLSAMQGLNRLTGGAARANLPRTLRERHAIAESMETALTTIRVLGNQLESRLSGDRDTDPADLFERDIGGQG